MSGHVTSNCFKKHPEKAPKKQALSTEATEQVDVFASFLLPTTANPSEMLSAPPNSDSATKKPASDLQSDSEPIHHEVVSSANVLPETLPIVDIPTEALSTSTQQSNIKDWIIDSACDEHMVSSPKCSSHRIKSVESTVVEI
ncbi:hypothetical protein N7461_006445 [Penicillium sp. DV-2018c]|nr:hypothetical protein N7461_006445 [Penicillium sp. DV-2018c]